MRELLWLVPALPLVGFLALALTAGRLPRPAVGFIGVGSVGLSLLTALAIAADFAGPAAEGAVFRQPLWQWLAVGDVTVRFGLALDALSLTMILVVTGVGFLVHLYSLGFLAGQEGQTRFFAYMNLFVAAMLILVLADSLLFLYVGWEGVGLCSFLLIGFRYRDPETVRAARKAFVVTRIGDAALVVGLALLVASLGTLDIAALTAAAETRWAAGDALPTAAAALLLAGAVGKSAQLPLQVWLPDAMAGPTPVSALIHAATMVTAGVYLIARMHGLFALAPPVQTAIAVIGAVTLLLAATSALAQTDIKRILAYSTISQIGYMVMALGVGAYGAAIFHLTTHAWFKALLFLAAGVVIRRLGDQHDVRRMGGLHRTLPGAFVAFLVGAASLAALPLVTAGSWSKELILTQVWGAGGGGPLLWLAGALGAVLTALYIFRAVFLVFFGPERTAPHGATPAAMLAPLAVLAVLAVVGGAFPVPAFLAGALPVPAAGREAGWLFGAIAVLLPLAGIYAAYRMYLARPGAPAERPAAPVPARLSGLWQRGWGFDALYTAIAVRPVGWFVRVNRGDAADALAAAAAGAGAAGHRWLSRTQTGRLRWYAGALAGGTALVLAVAVLA
jgi:NADH-quinone oxidoreductase subunit L